MSVVARTLCAVAAVALLAAPSATASSHVVQQLALLQRAGVQVPRVVKPVERRALTVDEPALAETYQPGIAWEWQWADSRIGEVPDWVLRAASSVKIAVIDSGADVNAPDLADKAPRTWSVLSRSTRVRDRLGHGTFVASLATGSVSNGTGVSGFGGDAQLLVVQAIDADGYITDVDEAAAIVYAVKHGAKIVNLSIGGSETSQVEQRAIRWAARRGVLIVAAAGNEHDEGNLPEYPAALLQPLGSHGRGGIGLAVGATSMDGTRSYFSNTGSYLSLAAPGYNVFAAESADAPWPRAQLPWSSPGLLRLGERHVVLLARGGRRGRARLGGEPAADRAAGGEGAEAERDRHDAGTASSAGAASTPPRRSSSRSRRRAWRYGTRITSRGRSTPRRPRRPPSSRAAPSP